MSRTTLFVDVIVPLAVPQKYTYRVPVELNDDVEPGKRVLVQFGKSKFYSAIVANVHDKAPTDYVAKYIDSVIDEKPIVLEKQLKFWDWMAYYYMCGPGEVMNAALPSALKLSSVANIQLNPEFNFEESDHSQFSDKEHLIIDALHHNDTLSFDDVSKILKIKSIHKTVNDLIKKGAILVYEEVKDKYKPKLLSFIKLGEEYLNKEHSNAEHLNEMKIKELLDKLETKAFKQAEVMLCFLHLLKSGNSEWISKNEIAKQCDHSAIGALVKKGVFIEEKKEVGRLNFENSASHKKALTKFQQTAYSEIKTSFLKNFTIN